MNLNEIRKPIANEMGKFKNKLRDSITSESKLIDTVINYVLAVIGYIIEKKIQDDVTQEAP